VSLGKKKYVVVGKSRAVSGSGKLTLGAEVLKNATAKQLGEQGRLAFVLRRVRATSTPSAIAPTPQATPARPQRR
jgi:hypothetical protein